MIIELTSIPDTVLGIADYGGKLPERMRYLSPAAARSFVANLHTTVIVSDMYRSAEASLRARKTRRGAQRPGYSGHNFGLSIDVDVTATMREHRVKSKAAFDNWMAARGWHCHRRDHKRDFEDWHYNYFGDEFDTYVRPEDSRTSFGLERMIQARHFPEGWRVPDIWIQNRLVRLGFYGGAQDGVIGPLTKAAISAFRRAWLLPTPNAARVDAMFVRTLAFVTADREIVPLS